MGHGGTERKKPKSLAEVTEKLKAVVGDAEGLDENMRARSRARKRLRSVDPNVATSSAREKSLAMAAGRTASRARSASVRGLSLHTNRSVSRVATSLGRPELQEKAETKKRKLTKQMYKKDAKKGEGDHHIPDWKPKHLFSGKRKAGKTDRR